MEVQICRRCCCVTHVGGGSGGAFAEERWSTARPWSFVSGTPRRGVQAIMNEFGGVRLVQDGGTISKGDEVKAAQHLPLDTEGFAVLTVLCSAKGLRVSAPRRWLHRDDCSNQLEIPHVAAR